MHKSPTVLLVNPWIHDFAAYDFWAKPLGLMILASILKDHGVDLVYIDCLDRHHVLSRRNSSIHSYGRGSYMKTLLPNPKGLEDIPRNYCRYGISPNWFKHDLRSIPPPNVILISSFMTYWYPGIKETIKVIKDVYPNVPIVLGGIYPSLCEKHAIETSGADHVVSGAGEDLIISIINKLTGWKPQLASKCYLTDIYPRPLLELQRKIDYIPILTGKGCPYNCSYCASSFLQPNVVRRKNKTTFEEILFWHKHLKINEFVFYDDALLVDSEQNIVPLLERVISSNIRVNFHTPNAVHIRKINSKISKLMFQAGFKTIRLGLETSNFENRNIDNKVKHGEFGEATRHLIEAGFQKNQVGVYLLVGLPNQEILEIEESVSMVKKVGICPTLAYYSPIPNTSMWKSAVSTSRYDLESDPIFTNNSILPCVGTSFSWKFLSKLKKIIRD